MAYKTRAIVPWRARFWRFVTPGDPDACWEWTGARNEHGYGRLNLGRAGAGQIKAHRASFEIHVGSIPDGMSVCHRCDNPPCVNPAHLFVGSMTDNLRDAAAKGRTGPQNGGSKPCRTITDEDVRAVREAMARGEDSRAVAARFGIGRPYVYTLALGRARTDAGGPITTQYLRGISTEEIVGTVASRRPPMITALAARPQELSHA